MALKLGFGTEICQNTGSEGMPRAPLGAKDKAQIPEQITGSKEQGDEEEEEERGLDKRTPAQVALEKTQEKQQMEGDPEESAENPQAASGGVELGCSDRALRHPKVSWTQ
uniref:Uncharacterized protein n=1 Tax=Serinus canaria TaxID=9135 RepID=A0A8C9L6S3_SERCA